jgi:hypothetical protein
MIIVFHCTHQTRASVDIRPVPTMIRGWSKTVMEKAQ